MALKYRNRSELEKIIDDRMMTLTEMSSLEKLTYLGTIFIGTLMLFVLAAAIFIFFSEGSTDTIECAPDPTNLNATRCYMPKQYGGWMPLIVILLVLMIQIAVVILIFLQKISSKLSALILTERVLSIDEKAVEKKISKSIKLLGED